MHLHFQLLFLIIAFISIACRWYILFFSLLCINSQPTLSSSLSCYIWIIFVLYTFCCNGYYFDDSLRVFLYFRPHLWLCLSVFCFCTGSLLRIITAIHMQTQMENHKTTVRLTYSNKWYDSEVFISMINCKPYILAALSAIWIHPKKKKKHLSI